MTYTMPAPLANRFSHFEVESNIDDWVSWAYANNIDEGLIGFLRFKPELLFDFDPARSILQQIESASQRCSAGVFLFTKDDELVKVGSKSRSVPRDNVVFEAGYFAGTKEKSRVLIVLQDGAKMPADLGGDIYASLSDSGNIDSIKPVLRQFAEAL